MFISVQYHLEIDWLSENGLEGENLGKRKPLKPHLMPTPPAIKITRWISSRFAPGGGHTKLPPTRTCNSFPRTSSDGRQSHAAGGLDGDSWTASSRNGEWSWLGSGSDDWGRASLGVEVIVNPPAFVRPGTWTSSHCPGRNFTGPFSSWYISTDNALIPNRLVKDTHRNATSLIFDCQSK